MGTELKSLDNFMGRQCLLGVNHVCKHYNRVITVVGLYFPEEYFEQQCNNHITMMNSAITPNGNAAYDANTNWEVCNQAQSNVDWFWTVVVVFVSVKKNRNTAAVGSYEIHKRYINLKRISLRTKVGGVFRVPRVRVCVLLHYNG